MRKPAGRTEPAAHTGTVTDVERYVRSNGTRLWTCSSGKGTPFLMFNGGPGCDDYLGPLARMVEDVCRVIRFEPRGCGRSDWDGNYAVETLIDDAEAVRRAYGARGCIVGGHSFGPNLALAYTLRYPDEVIGLIGIAGGKFVNDRTWSEAYHRNLDTVGEDLCRVPQVCGTSARPTGSVARRVPAGNGGSIAKGRNAATGRVGRALREFAMRATAALWPLPISRYYLRATPCIDAHGELCSTTNLRDTTQGGVIFAADPEVNQEGNRSWREYIKRPALFREIADLPIPATFINGSEDIRPSWPTRQLAALMPHGRHIEIDGAAHTVWLTHATELRAALREAITRIRQVG